MKRFQFAAIPACDRDIAYKCMRYLFLSSVQHEIKWFAQNGTILIYVTCESSRFEFLNRDYACYVRLHPELEALENVSVSAIY